jgi:hypothetical protein
MLAFSLLLAACGGKAGGDDTDDTGAQTGITNGIIAQGLQVKYLDGIQIPWEDDINVANLPNYTGTLDFNYCDGKPITDYVPGTSIKVTNGKLNMTLGTPKAEYLKTIDRFPTNWFIEDNINITVTPSNAKVLEEFFEFTTSDEAYELLCLNDYDDAWFTYADRDVTIKGTYSNYDYTQTYDFSFKKGWNYSTDEIYSSQTLPSGFYWIVYKNPYGNYGDFEYREYSAYISIERYNGAGGTVSIPSSIKGKPVTTIGYGAFSGCTSLTSVTIPDSVTSIGNQAFYCDNLISVTFQGTIPASGFDDGAFGNYSDLRDKFLTGGIGTYTRTSGSGDYSDPYVWTK